MCYDVFNATTGTNNILYASTNNPTQDCGSTKTKDYCWPANLVSWADGVNATSGKWMCRSFLFGLNFTDYGTTLEAYPIVAN